MAERVAASSWQQQVAGTILAVFAAVAFVLAVVGVHAVTRYSVEMRKAAGVPPVVLLLVATVARHCRRSRTVRRTDLPSVSRSRSPSCRRP